MADYTGLQRSLQQTNPAAPEGLQQEAARQDPSASRWDNFSGAMRQYDPAGYAADARSWFGGRNVEGVNSGWDTAFVDKMFKSYYDWNDKVAESRKSKNPKEWLNTYDWLDNEKNPGANGIAFWDDPKGRFRHGDVIEDGKVVPRQNVYEVYDRDTANLMLAPFLFSAQEQARFNRDSQRPERYEREVADRIEKATKDAGSQQTSLQYQADVYDEEARIHQRGTDVAAFTATSALASGAIGAGVGTAILPGLGTLIGGIGGTVIGGVGAWLNQDQMVEELARGRVQADRARDRYGSASWFASTLTTYGGVARKTITPLGNMVQGGYDALEGDVGDGTSEFNNVDPLTGKRTAHGWVQAADFAAALGDGVLQFASPAGQIAYTATMGVSVAGQIGQMATTGAGFNTRTGQWDSYEGAEWVSAIGGISIDALQMGMGAAMGGAARASRAAFGGRNVVTEGFLAKEGQQATTFLGTDLNAASRRTLGVYTPAEAEALITGRGIAHTEIHDGMKYMIDETGRAVSRRATATILAPSEAIGWAGASWRARSMSQAGRYGQGGNRVLAASPPASTAGRWVPDEVTARVDNAIGRTMPGPDDFYRASLSMATDSWWRTALITGYAEGMEEMIQAILEPMSFSEHIDPSDVVRSMLYGWASGVGMGAGARGASPEQKQFSRAHANYMERKGINMSADEFKQIYYGKGVTNSMRKSMAILDKSQAETMNRFMDVYKELHSQDQMGSVLPLTSLNSIRAKRFEQLHKNRNPNIEGSRVLMGRPDRLVAVNGMIEAKRFAEDAAVQSLDQTLIDLRASVKGLEVQEKALTREAARTDLLPERIAEIQAELARYPDLRRTADSFVGYIEGLREQYHADPHAVSRQLFIDQINELLDNAFNYKVRDARGNMLSAEEQENYRRIVEMRIARNPQQDPGSSQIFRPQVSMVLTHLRQDATTYIHQGTLKVMGADHDGDTGVLINSQVLGQDELQQLRRGAQFLQTVVSEDLVPDLDASGQPIMEPKLDENGQPIKDARGLPVMQMKMVGSRKNRVTVVRDSADGHKTRIDRIADALVDLSSTDRMTIAAKVLEDFADQVLKRYTVDYPIFSRPVLEDEILADFFMNIATQQYDAEQIFLDDMFNTEQAALLELADETHMPEMQWMEGAIERMWAEMQTMLAMNAAGEQTAVSSGVPVTLPEETAFQEGIAKKDAAADGLTLTTLLEYMTDPVRMAQGLHYAPFYRSAVLSGEEVLQGRFDPERLQEFIALFAQLGAGQMHSATEEVMDKNPIEDRVVRWLSGFLQEARRAYPSEPAFQNVSDGLMLLANLSVPDVNVTGVNEFVIGDRATTLLQILLKKSIAIEEFRQAGAREDDDLNKKITRLKELTVPEAAHSTTANRALIAVFGDVQMYKLAGRAADGVGYHLTPNQLVSQLTALGPDARRELASKWRRLPSMHPFLKERHDPPYVLDEYVSRVPDEYGNMQVNSDVNAFTMVMDAVIAEASAELHAMEKRDRTASEQFHGFHTSLRSMRNAWYRANSERLEPLFTPGMSTEDRQRIIFRDMIENGDQDIAAMIADILPDAAMLGIFRVNDGKVWTAKWLEQMLIEEDTAKAELMLFIHSKFAELNQMGGKWQLDKDIEKIRKGEKANEVPEDQLTPQRRIAMVDPRLIKSRFLQMVYHIASEDQTGHELDRLLALGLQSQSLSSFLETINTSEPNWIGDMSPLMAYHDDVSSFEEDIADIWKAEGSAGQQQREALRKSAIRMASISQTYAEEQAAAIHDRNLLADLEGYFTAQQANNDQGMQDFARVRQQAGQLMRLMANAATYPDIMGPAAIDQFMEAVQQGLFRLQDKGKPAEEAAGIGQAAISQLSMASYTAGMSQQLAALTSLDPSKVQANLSGLAKAKARIMLNDGSILVLDFTDPLNVVKMLRDPRTNSFAMAVLAPVQRDVDANNMVQHSVLISTAESDIHDTPLKRILADTQLSHLFPRQRMAKASYAQAIQTLGMLDSAARASAVGKSEEVQAHADNMSMKVINELLVANMHGQGYENRDKAALRKELLQNLATVWQNLTLVDEEHIPEVKRLMQEKLKDRYLRDESAWSRLDLTRDDVNRLDILITDSVRAAFEVRLNKLLDEAATFDQTTTQETLDKNANERRLLREKLATYTAQKPLHERVMDLPPSVSSAIHAWTQFINDDSDPDRMATVRIALLEYLNTNNRMDRMVGSDTYRLGRIVRSVLKNDPNEIVRKVKITEDQWTAMAMSAATTMVAESAAHFSSGIGLVELQSDSPGEPISRLYDRSWSFILDGILDVQPLSLMRQMAKQAKYVRPDVTINEVVGQMDDLLFSERRLGRWTPLAVTEILRAHHALGGATVTGAIQGPGGLPMEMRDVIGATWMSYGMPDPNQHHSTVQLAIPHTLQTPGTFVGAIDPRLYMKLEHHFVRSVKLTGPEAIDPSNPTAPPTRVTVDLTRPATDAWMREEAVSRAGYRVFRGDFLQKLLEDFQRQHGEGEYSVEIEYVDVDKKPHTSEYVNSILFDGAGPSSQAGLGPGPIADTIFGTGQLNKEGQQQPLNYATKGGAAFRQIATVKYEAVLRGERTGTPLADILAAKALVMWNTEYETGTLPLGANNALYKLLKLRHIVRGKDADGKTVYLWAEDVIHRETMGLPLPFVGPYQLIALSTPVLQTLLGRTGMQGTPALIEPELNLRNTYEPLSVNLNLERLRELGLDRLGENAVLANTSFAAVSSLPPATTQTVGKGKERVSAIKSLFRIWQGEQLKIHGNRTKHESVFRSRTINKLNKDFLKDMTRSELLATIMSRINVPYAETQDVGAIKLSDVLEKSLKNIIGRNGVIWVHRHSETPDPTQGLLGRASISSGVPVATVGQDHLDPTLGDAVVLDLDDLLVNKQDGTQLNLAEAKTEAKEIIRAYAKKGVIVVLGAKSAQHLRSDLAQWMREGEVGYVSMKGSSHYFEPARVDKVTSKNVDALESTLEEVRMLSANGVQYRLVSDVVGNFVSENATLFDYQHADQVRFKRVINVLLPASLTGSRIGQKLLWNLPIRGEGENDQWSRLREQLTAQLADPEHIAHLKKLSGGVDGNPKDVPLIIPTANGEVTNGVRSFDDAMRILRNNLTSGILPTDTGQTLVAGDFYVAISARGEPLLLRYGFKIPNGLELNDQLDATLGHLTHVDGEDSVGIGIAKAKLQEEQTVPPPLRIRRAFGDEIGLRLEGEYDTSIMTKDMLQGLGFKAGYTPMPENWLFPIEPMSALNGMRVTSAVSEKAVASKQATGGFLRNMRELFILTGIDFKKDLVNFLLGDNPRDEQQFKDDWAKVKLILNEWSHIDWGKDMDALKLLLDTGGAVNWAQTYLNAAAAEVVPGWNERNFIAPVDANPQDPTTRIGTAIMVTLMIPGIQLEHVIGTRGMLNVEDRTSNAQIMAMPPFLTEALNNPRFKETREEIFKRANANAGWPTTVDPVSGRTVPLYQIDPDFTFKIRMRKRDGTEMLEEAKLQRIASLPFEKDSASVAAAQISQKSNVSPHIATIGAETIGSWTALDPGKPSTAETYIPNDIEELFGRNDIKYFDTDGSSFHEIFARMKTVTDHYSPWERRLPGQMKYLRDSTAKRVSYYLAIPKKDENGNYWSKDAEALAMQFLEKLNLKRDQLYEVDILVRQFLGKPGPQEGQRPSDYWEIDEKTYRQVVTLMIDNITKYMHPLHGGAVPMESESFWVKVFHAQRDLTKEAWQPMKKVTRKRGELAVTWDQWVDTLFDQVRDSTAPFHGMYRMDLDGFMHTYQSNNGTFNSLPISLDTQRDLMLMDPATNTYYISMDPLTNKLWESPLLLDSMDFTLNTLTGHDSDLVRYVDAASTPASAIAEQLERQIKWLKGQKLAKQRPTTVRKYYQEGVAYRQSAQETSNFFLALNHIEIINRLFVPGLFVSGFLEVPFRNMLEHFTNIAGGAQLSRGGVVMARNAERMGLKPVFTPEQVKLARKTAESMGSKTEFKAMIAEETYFKDILHKAAPNRFNAWLENRASTVARLTGDPRLGMTSKSAAMRYLEAALEFEMKVDSNVSVEQILKHLMEDPLWLEKNSAKSRVSAHSVGINRVASVRGTRQSAINKAFLSRLDKWQRGDTAGKQWAGWLLGVPFRFKRFNIGTMLKITGLDGFDQLFAMMRDQRPTATSVIGRWQAAMRGQDLPDEEIADYSDVIESIDLARPFIRGGFTQMALLAGAMYAGHLGLDGEDEETKRRRRMLKYLNGMYLYDPRRAENDFLYADALFLDSIPVLSTMFQDESGRSAVIPHWILRQFTSPVMGIQRFLNTGDLREIGWGFQDAIAVIPYSVINTWNNAQEAANILSVEANDYRTENGEVPEAQSAVTQMLINIGSVYEHALLENSFVNGLRNGADEFDRDPFKEVQRDENGNIVYQNGEPLPTSDLMAYRQKEIDPVTGEEIPGQVAQAYDKRSIGGISGGQSHAYAEKNFTYSLLASLFTGQINPMTSTFNRNNMAIKERSIELPEATQAQAEALILSAFRSRSLLDAPQEMLTEDEITRILKNTAENAGVYWNQADIEADAKAIHQAQSGQLGGLSILDSDANEVITQAGARSVYQSLYGGALKWEDASLEGIVIPWQMRDKIAAEWLAELMQWGVDQGMSEQGAQYYAKRIWYGDQMNPDAPGLKELLYDDRIPGDGTVKYNQLNMTYVMGPDGRPWATPFRRDSVLAAFGLPIPQRTPASGTGMSKDERGKSVDEVLGINTGLHGLVRKPTEKYEPPEDLFDKVAAQTYTPGNGYQRYPRTKYAGGGGGGGGYFQRMQPFPRGTAPDLQNIPFLSSTNPYIRRADVNRQRITSERERLKQWQ